MPFVEDIECCPGEANFAILLGRRFHRTTIPTSLALSLSMAPSMYMNGVAHKYAQIGVLQING
jgi:hypothetical protein